MRPLRDQQPSLPSPELPTLEEAFAARIQFRKDARSGHPAKKAEAVRRLNAIERIIRDIKARDADDGN